MEYLINNYGLVNIINNQNKRRDNLLLRAIKDQNEYLIHFLLNNPNVELDAKDDVYQPTWNFIVLDREKQSNVCS